MGLDKDNLIMELDKLGLVLRISNDIEWVIGAPYVEDMMLHFNPNLSCEDYSGEVVFKVLNMHTFTSNQIKGALGIVERFHRGTLVG